MLIGPLVGLVLHWEASRCEYTAHLISSFSGSGSLEGGRVLGGLEPLPSLLPVYLISEALLMAPSTGLLFLLVLVGLQPL